MKRVDVASALIFNQSKEKVLLVKNKNEDISYWSPPGGAVEKGETLHQAVIREIKEETGYDIAVVGLSSVREVFFSDSEHHALIFTFIAKIVGGEINILDPDNEIVEVEWVDIDIANKLMPSIPNIIKSMGENENQELYSFEGTR